MKFLGFSLEHHGEGKAARFQQLRRLLDELSQELAAEREALRAQHDYACADAAFALEAMENGDTSAATSDDIDRLTSTIAARAGNFAALDEQAACVEALRQRLGRLDVQGRAQGNVAHHAGWGHLAS